jgi:hypothetical protein
MSRREADEIDRRNEPGNARQRGVAAAAKACGFFGAAAIVLVTLACCVSCAARQGTGQAGRRFPRRAAMGAGAGYALGNHSGRGWLAWAVLELAAMDGGVAKVAIIGGEPGRNDWRRRMRCPSPLRRFALLSCARKRLSDARPGFSVDAASNMPNVLGRVCQPSVELQVAACLRPAFDVHGHGGGWPPGVMNASGEGPAKMKPLV